MHSLKIGAVSYLNTKPLVAGLDRASSPCDVVFDLPSRLADRLKRGEMAVALIPLVEAVTNNYVIVSDACIACRGPVWSVKLFSRVPGPAIKTLALDEGSRTSRILGQLLLFKRWGIRPDKVSLAIDQPWRSSQEDAVLVIGDRAMNVDDQGFEFSWDLGQEWLTQTGSPFVFAVWAAHPDSLEIDYLDEILTESRNLGIRTLDEIVNRHAASYGLSLEACERYLKQHLHFTMGGQEVAGARQFLSEATQYGFLPPSKLNLNQPSRFINQ